MLVNFGKHLKSLYLYLIRREAMRENPVIGSKIDGNCNTKKKQPNTVWNKELFPVISFHPFIYSHSNRHCHHQFTVSAYFLINLNSNEIPWWTEKNNFVRKLQWECIAPSQLRADFIKIDRTKNSFYDNNVAHGFPHRLYYRHRRHHCRENKIVIFLVVALAFSACSFTSSSSVQLQL